MEGGEGCVHDEGGLWGVRVIREQGLLGNVFVVSGMRKETGRPVIASIQTEPTGNAGNSRGENARAPSLGVS